MLLAVLLASNPVPGPIKAFGDWMVACDNLRSCAMTSLARDEELETDLRLMRQAGRDGAIEIAIETGIFVGRPRLRGQALIAVDGRQVAVAIARWDVLRIAGADARRVAAAMVDGRVLSVATGARTMRVSLTGSSAALRFIDAEQGRAGTVTAMVAKGATAVVPTVRAMPRVRAIRPGGRAASIPAALKAAIYPHCTDQDQELPEIQAFALGGGATLALLQCGGGSYNDPSIAFVVRGGKAALARFDYPPGTSAQSDRTPQVYNAEWDARAGHLNEGFRARGIGDCGNRQTYVWDGAMFRLVESRQMPECRGSSNLLTVWRATPVMR